jgi:UDP-glucuronate 4-epimerase
VKSLITGVAGFVGSHLAGRLLRDGWDVVGIDSLTDYYDPGLKLQNLGQLRQSERFSFIEGDLNVLPLPPILGEVEFVFHQAGQPGVRKSWGSEFHTYAAANISATQRLLEACTAGARIRRVVYASSSSIYGDSERFPARERDRPQPRSPYGVTKLAAEHLCSLYAANFEVPVVSLRYFTVYGPGQRPDMAFTRFVRAALTGESIELYGSGEQIRDFTYVDDVVDANVRAALGQLRSGAVLNVAGGTSVSLLDAIAIIEELTGRRLRVEKLPGRAGDVHRTGGDTRAIRDALGWRPSVTLTEGLGAQVEWVRGVLAGS